MSEQPPSGQGAVLLDVGEELGALVVTMPAELTGAEIEIRELAPASTQAPRHVGVWPRRTPAGLVHAAVFDGLAAGRYVLYQRPAGPPRLQVEVTAATVTFATWQ